MPLWLLSFQCIKKLDKHTMLFLIVVLFIVSEFAEEYWEIEATFQLQLW